MADITALAEVRIWGQRVGAVAEDADGVITFEYDDDFRTTGLEISPVHLPLGFEGPVQFPELRRLDAFRGLPGVLADALPDRFGNAVIQRYFRDRGEPERALSPVQKLLYVGDRAMGALQFRPALEVPARAQEQVPLEIAELVAQALSIVEGKTDVAVPEIIRVGGSAGGMRPKALVLWNPETDKIRSGHAVPELGDEYWLLKFDGVHPAGSLGEEGEFRTDQAPLPYMRMEHAYSELARRAGLNVVETRFLKERRYAHLLVRRYDRVNGQRVHQHTLGGLQHVDYNQAGAYSYEGYLRTVLELGLGYEQLEEAYRRVVFNVAAVNQDDHVKNLSFLMDSDGSWRLSPAYDLTFSRGQGWTRGHQMSVNGKRSDIERSDLAAVGKKYGIKRSGEEVIDQVASALGDWEPVAAQAGVPNENVKAIREQLRLRGLARE
jgi:serine/threonine-protein kinase HipA